MRQGVRMDGEFYLRVKSRILQVRLSCLNRTHGHTHTHSHTQQALTSSVAVVWPQIYCAEMQTEFPKEFVTLRSGQTDNYSEVYGNRCARRLRLRFRPDHMVYSVCDRKLSLPIAGC